MRKWGKRIEVGGRFKGRAGQRHHDSYVPLAKSDGIRRRHDQYSFREKEENPTL